MFSYRISFVIFIIIVHTGYSFRYNYDPRWKWKKNQFVELNDDIYLHPDDVTSENPKTSQPPPFPPVVKGSSDGTDEDLLDLMVRIAETPSEWEKIHQVLSQLGKNQPKNDIKNTTKNNTTLTESYLSTTTTSETTTLKSTAMLPKTNENAIKTTDHKFNTHPNTKETLHNAHLKNSNTKLKEKSKKIDGTKYIWPDIFKSEYEKLFWNAENVYDDEMKNEEDYDEDDDDDFSEYLLDEKCNDKNDNINNKIYNSEYNNNNVNDKINNNNIFNKNVNNKTVNNDFVKFINKISTTTENNNKINNNNEDSINIDNNNNKNNDNKKNWPNFSYHRVTVNPNKEKSKNRLAAFIVVSEISPKNETNNSSSSVSSNVDSNINSNVKDHGDSDEMEMNGVPQKHNSKDLKSKNKILRHHWRDKQKHSKKRHRKIKHVSRYHDPEEDVERTLN